MKPRAAKSSRNSSKSATEIARRFFARFNAKIVLLEAYGRHAAIVVLEGSRQGEYGRPKVTRWGYAVFDYDPRPKSKKHELSGAPVHQGVSYNLPVDGGRVVGFDYLHVDDDEMGAPDVEQVRREALALAEWLSAKPTRTARKNSAPAYGADLIREIPDDWGHRRDLLRGGSFTANAIDLGYYPAGNGKDRIVFKHEDGNWVIKIAFREIGELANQQEAARWERADAKARKWLLPVLAADPDGKWLVMRSASDEELDLDWFDSYYRWLSSEKLRDRPSMPPRKLVGAIEHANDAEDWLMYHGHPVMFDYS